MWKFIFATESYNICACDRPRKVAHKGNQSQSKETGLPLSCALHFEYRACSPRKYRWSCVFHLQQDVFPGSGAFRSSRIRSDAKKFQKFMKFSNNFWLIADASKLQKFLGIQYSQKFFSRTLLNSPCIYYFIQTSDWRCFRERNHALYQITACIKHQSLASGPVDIFSE